MMWVIVLGAVEQVLASYIWAAIWKRFCMIGWPVVPGRALISPILHN
jgi:hypothetical protein